MTVEGTRVMNPRMRKEGRLTLVASLGSIEEAFLDFDTGLPPVCDVPLRIPAEAGGTATSSLTK